MRKLLIILFSFLYSVAYSQGTEMITNGTFDSATGWSTNAAYSISGGVASFDSTAIGTLSQADGDMVSSIEANTEYTISFTISGGTAGIIFMSTSYQTYIANENYPATTYEFQFTTPANIGDGGILLYTYDDHAFSIDNFSLKENYTVGASPYYVAPADSGGDDTNPGTLELPFKTWQRGINVAYPGDTVYIRGGIYNKPAGFNAFDGTGRNGTADSFICIFNYPGETPIMDLSTYYPTGVVNQAMGLSWTTYIHFRGLTIRNVWQREAGYTAQGWEMYGCSNIKMENITIHDVGGRACGFFGAFGVYRADSVGTGSDYEKIPNVPADTTWFINCDFYNLCDSLCNNTTDSGYCDTYYAGGIADGIKWNNTAGSYCLIDGCRGWSFSDNAYDPNGMGLIEIKNSWAFLGGYQVLPGYEIEGNGIKYGNQVEVDTSALLRTVINCISAYNTGIGFDENNAREGFYKINEHIYNNVSYHNNIGYGNISRDYGTQNQLFSNNISYQDNDDISTGDLANIVSTTNSWDDPPGVTITDDDFIASLDSATVIGQLLASRKADGSLPDITVFRLAPTSPLVGAGTDVGMSSDPNVGLDFDYLDGESQIDSTANDITGFTLASQTGAATINSTNHTVDIEVEYGTNVTSLSPDITLSFGATSDPTSGAAQDFTSPVNYTVTSLDATEQVWTATVTVAAAPEEPVDYSGYRFTGQVDRQGRPVYTRVYVAPAEVLVTGIDVTGTGGATTITTDGGTLQMLADVSPDNADDTTITWSRINRTGTGSISSGGLLTAVTDGVVTVRADANDTSGVYDTLQITFSNQVEDTLDFTYPDLLESNMVFWGIPDTTYMVMDEDTIRQWTDISGNTKHMLQSPDALITGPYWDADSSALYFDTSSEIITRDSVLTDQPLSYHLLVTFGSTFGGARNLTKHRPTPDFYTVQYNDFSMKIDSDYLTTPDITIADAGTGEWFIISFIWDGANSRMVVNNGTPATGTLDGTDQWFYFQIGEAHDDAAMCWVKEAIVRNVNDADNVGTIQGYLFDKYGADHYIDYNE